MTGQELLKYLTTLTVQQLEKPVIVDYIKRKK